MSNAASKLGAAEDDAIAETPQPRSHSRRAHGVPLRSLERTNQAKQSNAARCTRLLARHVSDHTAPETVGHDPTK